MSVKIRPLHDRVLVKRLEEEEQVKGGIIIPDTAKEKPQEAEVVAVGPGKLQDDGKRQPMDVSAGDRILVGKYSGSEIKIGDEDLGALEEPDDLTVEEAAAGVQVRTSRLEGAASQGRDDGVVIDVVELLASDLHDHEGEVTDPAGVRAAHHREHLLR